MSGAGKSAIGEAVYEKLKARRPNIVFLDGDGVREIMGDDLGHTLDDRRANAERICRMGKYFHEQGIDVVCAILSIFPETREWNREQIDDYVEVYIDTPFEILVERDSKGLYKKALAGEIHDVVGVDIEFPVPTNPDLIIKNGAPLRPLQELADEIIHHLDKRGIQ
jgi:adenylylsulfate kinase-like enzyme